MFGNKLHQIDKLVAAKKAAGIAALVNDKKTDVQAAAIAALGKVDDDVSYNTLVPLLRSASPAVRSQAAAALAELGRRSARVHIEHQLAVETDEGVKAALNEALRKLHEEA